ncbi:tRNA1(Val) (adenine(37)-N6)-methyltransferase [Dongshaea marina]|uniref:tRNA1(Val) (adenine(37)-N6)-methyltransferase n=1 Tax=Dongshaea marina TaxID=2047966 RepID=UPI000D3E25B1|nr:methyltransferase [Dongshaea marina]
MKRSGFSFKRFHLEHDRCGMKIGTDGILLGSWAPLARVSRALDIGTGCGLIALMLAQRSPDSCLIEGVELDVDAASQAAENVCRSPWGSRVQIHHQSIQKFSAVPFDLIVSNPPYYPYQHRMDNHARRHARQTVTLGEDELCLAAQRLLAPEGKLALIIPAECEKNWFEAAEANNLHIIERCEVITREGKLPTRILLLLARQSQPLIIKKILVHQADGLYSEQFIALTRDFYLKM